MKKSSHSNYYQGKKEERRDSIYEGKYGREGQQAHMIKRKRRDSGGEEKAQLVGVKWRLTEREQKK